MCIPLHSFFKGVREFRKSIRELKSSLKHLRQILSGILKISRDFEDVTKEIKNIVEFYSNESKGAIQDQLKDMMTSEAQDELYYKEFLKHYKNTFDNWITWFLRTHSATKQTTMAVIEIVQRMRFVVNHLKPIVRDDQIKTNVLSDIDDFMYQAHQQHERDVHLQNEATIATDQNATTEHESKLNIKIFCDKQKVTNNLEEMLSFHLGVQPPPGNACANSSFLVERPQEYNFGTNHLVYRERATRIRKLRHYLSSKIKLKRIGDFYREELSLQIQLDLEKAAKQLWDFEIILHENTQNWAKALRQLPKQRFSEVLQDNHVNDIQCAVNYVFTNSPEEIAPTIEVMAEKLGVVNVIEGVQGIIDQTTDKIKTHGNETISSYVRNNRRSLENIVDLQETEVLLTLINKYVQKSVNKKVKHDGDNYNTCSINPYIKYDGDNHNICSRIDLNMDGIRNNINVSDSCLSKKGEFEWSPGKIDEFSAITIHQIPNILSIDRELIYSDIKMISRPVINLLITSSSALAVTLVDKTLLGTSDVINAVSTVVMSIQNNDATANNKENVFLKSALCAILPGFPLEDVRFLTKLYDALQNSKENRKKILAQVEKSLTDKLLDEGGLAIEKFQKIHVEEFLNKKISDLLNLNN